MAENSGDGVQPGKDSLVRGNLVDLSPGSEERICNGVIDLIRGGTTGAVGVDLPVMLLVDLDKPSITINATVMMIVQNYVNNDWLCLGWTLHLQSLYH